MTAIQVILCFPFGASAVFCGWGRSACTLCLRSEDVSVNDVAVVVLVSLRCCDVECNTVLHLVDKLLTLNRAFDRVRHRSLFSLLDVSPRVNWYHVVEALDLSVMFHDDKAVEGQSGSPPCEIRVLLENLLQSIVDSPWLLPSTDVGCTAARKRPFSSVTRLENTVINYRLTPFDPVLDATVQISPTIPYPV